MSTTTTTPRAGASCSRVTRTADKQFRQCRPDPTAKSGWAWNLKGIGRPLPLYRLPKVLKSVAAGNPVFVCEGEKDVGAVERLGFTVTTKAGGAGGVKWEKVDLTPLHGARVIVLPDHDSAGTKYALGLLEAIGDRAAVRIVHLPGLSDGGDVSDWVEAGGTREQLEAMVSEASEVESEVEVGPRITHQLAATITPTRPEWLWKGWLLLRALNLLTGRQGSGKTTFVAHVVAALTTDIPLPGDTGHDPILCAVLSLEEPPDRVVARLHAAGADLDRVHVLGDVEDYDEVASPTGAAGRCRATSLSSGSSSNSKESSSPSSTDSVIRSAATATTMR